MRTILSAQQVPSVSIPTKLSDLADDVDHHTVSDSEKSTWNDKQNKPVYLVLTDITGENEYDVGSGLVDGGVYRITVGIELSTDIVMRCDLSSLNLIYAADTTISQFILTSGTKGLFTKEYFWLNYNATTAPHLHFTDSGSDTYSIFAILERLY